VHHDSLRLRSGSASLGSSPGCPTHATSKTVSPTSANASRPKSMKGESTLPKKTRISAKAATPRRTARASFGNGWGESGCKTDTASR